MIGVLGRRSLTWLASHQRRCIPALARSLIKRYIIRIGCVAVAFVVVLVGTAGCRPQLQNTVPQVPRDAQEYTPVDVPQSTAQWQGEMSGEVTQDSVILQARLTEDGRVRTGDVKGRVGIGAFALSMDRDFQDAFRTRWLAASAEYDYILKANVSGLKPGARYYYRLLSGPGAGSVQAGPTGTFRTLDARGVSRETSFVVVTGMNRFAFLALALKDLALEDRSLGFPSLAAITAQPPDFFVATGDNVYYDTPFIGRADTRESMRAKWHRQFATPRFAALFQQVPTYWEKDDHDYRYDDADPYGPGEPSAELGAAVFLEQVPVVDPSEAYPRTYRTHRVNDLLQIWLLEGRDHREPNTKAPGPDKTLWGEEQKSWLKRTLLESDAVFKILISPTPLIGPDDRVKGVQGGILATYFGGRALGQGDDERKRDNHTNPFGFKDEGDAFFDWLSDHAFQEKNLYIVCGDRHWQYHSVRPDGFEEFSTGAIVDGNARLGPDPGDSESTVPGAWLTQPYDQEEPSGGYLKVTVRPSTTDSPPTAEFSHYDEYGRLLNTTMKTAVP